MDNELRELRKIVKELAVLVRAMTCGGNEEQDARLQRIIARLGAPSTPPEDERGVKVDFVGIDELHIDGVLVAQDVCFSFREKRAILRALRPYILPPTVAEWRLAEQSCAVPVDSALKVARRLGVVREE